MTARGILLLLPIGALLAQPPVRFDAGTISGLPARNIGSAQMSGRVAAVAAVSDGGRLTVFAASASGGVWKSVNGGTSFKPVFDNPAVQSMGAVAIDPGNPKNVWAGTGESWVRNSVSIGDGIYKSTDGGENWNNMGLKDSEHIAKILIHPRDGNTVYACAMGHLWDDNNERGVYKTTDGGKTWRKVLAGGNASTGCAMLSMSAGDPKTIYAALWDFRRQAWTFRSGGPGSGLFKSTDAGDHWTEITRKPGLPKGVIGRIGIAVSPVNSDRVWAIVEAEDGGVFKSDNGGNTWTKENEERKLRQRAWYYSRIVADPKRLDSVYVV